MTIIVSLKEARFHVENRTAVFVVVITPWFLAVLFWLTEESNLIIIWTATVLASLLDSVVVVNFTLSEKQEIHFAKDWGVFVEIGEIGNSSIDLSCTLNRNIVIILDNRTIFPRAIILFLWNNH